MKREAQKGVRPLSREAAMAACGWGRTLLERPGEMRKGGKGDGGA